jgi:DNA-binding NarL/FixJ family response regulator
MLAPPGCDRPQHRLTLVPSAGIEADAIRVAVVAGKAVVRAGLRALLDRDDRIAAVGEAANAEDALSLAHGTAADVALVDVNMADTGCVETTRRLRDEAGAAVVLLTTAEGDDRIDAGLLAGASGVLLYDAGPRELVAAVEVAAAGGTVLAPGVAHRLIAPLAVALGRGQRADPHAASGRLPLATDPSGSPP